LNSVVVKYLATNSRSPILLSRIYPPSTHSTFEPEGKGRLHGLFIYYYLSNQTIQERIILLIDKQMKVSSLSSLLVSTVIGFLFSTLSQFAFIRIMSVAGGSSSCPNEVFTDDKPLMTVSDLISQPPETIVNEIGGIYEHSPWVVETLLLKEETSKITTVSELAARLKLIVNGASDDKKLTLLQAHPDLCEKVEAMKLLTVESKEEQSKSGLQSMEGEELDKFKSMNESYRAKFGFPFILAVRNASKSTVLSALEGRLKNSSSQREFMVALDQVHNIAWMRLLSKVNTDDAAGFLTCHGTCYPCLFVCEIFAVSTFAIIIAIFPNIIYSQFYWIATTK
jgi:OHCU decarboxylase